MNFIDEAKIHLKAGDGGNGCISFRREKFMPKGGPDGGNGGNGGDIIVVSDHHLNTLTKFRFQQHFTAVNGRSGSSSNKNGKSGQELIITVPVGTQILDEHKQHVIYDFVSPADKFKIIAGGKGGLGNTYFKSSVNQAPRKRTFGEEGKSMSIWLHLKLISDVGLIGLPNAGKSTFLSVISAAKPKIADYPFTTLTPNLGVAYINEDDFVVADIPGLIAGAHLGRGLGDKFLKHIERCRIIIHLIDSGSDNLLQCYHTIRQELTLYSPNLKDKHEILCLSKADANDAKILNTKILELEKAVNKKVYAISSFNKNGIKRLLSDVVETLKSYKMPK